VTRADARALEGADALALPPAPASDLTGDASGDLQPLADVRCPVEVVLGTARISVRQCLSLAPRTVLKLQQAAGEDVRVVVANVPVARGEVVVVADNTTIRLTAIIDPGSVGER
jgi:flagellar motor switch protein FliN/FliY